MPTLLRSGPYRLFFYSGDQGEAPHVHVERENSVAKIWLDPVRLERNIGFRAAELRRIERIVVGSQSRLLEGWHGYFESWDRYPQRGEPVDQRGHAKRGA